MTIGDRRTFRIIVFWIVFFGFAVGVGLVVESGPVAVAAGLGAALLWALASGPLLGTDPPEPGDPPPDDPKPASRLEDARRLGPGGRARPPRARRSRRRP